MNQSVTVTGMVLSATPIGEYDRRVVLLTKEKGKISAFAKGARRQNSPLIAAAVPISFGEFVLYEGRTSHNIMQAQITNFFTDIKQDLDKVCYASYFAEFADYFTKEYNDEVQMLKLLYQTMRALESGKIPYDLIRYIYELKTLVVNGMYPQLFECSYCGSKEALNVFDYARHGVVCDNCRIQAKSGREILPSVLYAMQFVVASDIRKLYTFTLTDEVFGEFKRIITIFIQEHVEKRFKSLEFLNGALSM